MISTRHGDPCTIVRHATRDRGVAVVRLADGQELEAHYSELHFDTNADSRAFYGLTNSRNTGHAPIACSDNKCPHCRVIWGTSVTRRGADYRRKTTDPASRRRKARGTVGQGP
jgi:hypothetical protein